MSKLFASVALAAALAVPGIVKAQDEVDVGDVNLTLGTDLVSAYVFRGYEYQDSGYIVQPYAQVGIAAYKTEDLTISPYVGVWNSIHDRKEPGDGHFYESDLYGGVEFAWDYFSLDAIYTAYTAPDDAFDTVEEIGLKLAYDDSREAEGMGLPFTFSPYVAWYKEISDRNEGGTQDQYLEVGIDPTLPIEDTPFTLNFPIALGMSPDSFFLDDDGGNEFFGFASAGAYLTYAIPVSYGEWSVYGGVTYYYLMADSVQTFDPAATGDGEDRNSEVVGKIGIAFSM